MRDENAKAECYWIASLNETAPAFDALPGDIEVDVAIIGGGMVGMMTAERLIRDGRQVAVLEAGRVGRQVTGHSTAKITSQHNLIYHDMVKKFGQDTACAYAEANEAGIRDIETAIETYGLDCDFSYKAAYVVSRLSDDIAKIREEAKTALELGLPVSFGRAAPLPFPVAAAMKFNRQAQFHPCKFIAGLAEALAARGCRVYEQTRVHNVEHGDPCLVHTGHGVVTVKDVVMATHMPLGKTGMFFAKAYPYVHPMIAARIDDDQEPDGMFISTENPSWSVRTTKNADGTCSLIAVGGKFKPGHPKDEQAQFRALRKFLRDGFGVDRIDYHWTNMEYGPMDDMPFIGRASGHKDRLYVATGFNAWGITNSAVAARIIADLIAGRDNRWTSIFDATRTKPLAGGKTFVTENAKAGKEMVAGYLHRHNKSVADIAPGKSAIIKQNGERIAVYKSDDGLVHAVSAVCPHMGCMLGWNDSDRSWDCPCHGSRFSFDGALIHGPATQDLAPKTINVHE